MQQESYANRWFSLKNNGSDFPCNLLSSLCENWEQGSEGAAGGMTLFPITAPVRALCPSHCLYLLNFACLQWVPLVLLTFPFPCSWGNGTGDWSAICCHFPPPHPFWSKENCGWFPIKLLLLPRMIWKCVYQAVKPCGGNVYILMLLWSSCLGNA